jgi:hypothetical protein
MSLLFQFGWRITRMLRVRQVKQLRAEGKIADAEVLAAVIREDDKNPPQTPEELIARLQRKLALIRQIEGDVVQESIMRRTRRLKELQMKAVPPGQQIMHILAIWATSFSIGLAMFVFNIAPPGQDPAVFAQAMADVGLYAGSAIATFGTFLYLVWTFIHTYKNLRQSETGRD